MKQLLITLTVFITGLTTLKAQEDSIRLKIIEDKIEQSISWQNEQQKRLSQLEYKTRTNDRKISNEISELKSQIEVTINKINNNIEVLNIENQDLDNKIDETKEKAENELKKADRSINKVKKYWLYGLILVSLCIIILYSFLQYRIKSNSNTLENLIKKTRQNLEEEALVLDNKLVEVLETQMKLQLESNNSKQVSRQTDHSLALKVADEIVRMHKNIHKMDKSLKGIKPLEKGIERIQSNFAANGYEMINLLNCDYDERMNIDVINFIEDESIDKGKKIISKVIKPQVNYNGTLIQRAQIEVTQN